MSQVHRAMMVLPEHAALAASLAAALASVSGAGMFATPVYDNDGVIRYRASNGNIDEEFAALVDDASGDALWAAVQSAGAQVPEAAVRALMAGAVVRADCNVLDIVAEMGLYGHTDPKGQNNAPA